MILMFTSFQVAAALGMLQLIGVTHGDIKQENIMLVHGSRPFKVKLIDFGLSYHASEVESVVGGGTQWYM